MSGSGSGLGGSAGLWLAAGASVVIVGAAAWYSLSGQTDVSQAALVPAATTPTVTPAPTPQDEGMEETATPDPATQTQTASAETAPQDPAPAPEQAAPVLPAFDEVRRENDGMTIIAGRAAPGSVLKVLQNGMEVASVTADNSGKFATFLMIPPTGEGHVLSLEQTLNGEVLASDGEIILAPMAVAEAPVAEEPSTEEPVQVATAETEESSPAEPPQPATAETEPPAEATDSTTQTATVENTDDPALAPATANTLAEAPLAPAPPAEEAPTQDLAAAVPTAPAPAPKPAPQQTAAVVLKSTSDGVELLSTAPPEAMNRVALDTISYSDLGEVQLSGRAQIDTQSVRVYLDNAPIARLTVDAAGRWRGDLPDIDEGIYTLRVDEVAEDGTVTSRVETPFKRENPEVLTRAAAEQAGPLKRITVQRGNTLWAIARDRYGEGQLYVRVFQANADDIRDPDLIYPGQVFDLPD